MAQYYSVRPKQVFLAAEVTFYPGRGEYLVAEEVYNGKTVEGQDFKDMCDPNPPVVNMD